VEQYWACDGGGVDTKVSVMVTMEMAEESVLSSVMMGI
jgi:hypothetical protein